LIELKFKKKQESIHKNP